VINRFSGLHKTSGKVANEIRLSLCGSKQTSAKKC
jgi:hypothetical protein